MIKKGLTKAEEKQLFECLKDALTKAAIIHEDDLHKMPWFSFRASLEGKDENWQTIVPPEHEID